VSARSRFEHGVEPPPGGAPRPAHLFAFRGERMAVLELDGRALLPDDARALEPVRRQYLGRLDGVDAWSLELPADADPPGLEFRDLRTLHAHVEQEIWAVAARAFQVIHWDRTHQFCGACGAPTERVSGERARRCTGCGDLRYPRIAPAVIVAVTRGDELLMARNVSAPPGRFSVLAGFVEPGETLEETVAREVEEETGIAVQDVRYFGSQSWPFPSTMMVGFTARYAAGEIRVDGSEIAEAGWFRADSIPPSPRPGLSISGELIADFIRRMGG
jgi:NAD+ diphosphatase